MKKLLVIPTTIFPYTVCLCLGYGFIAQSFSNATIGVLGVFAFVALVLSFICNLIYIFTTKENTAKELIKIAFLIKAVHIPTYILIFVLGVLAGLMFFMTFPFIVFLIFIDLLTLWMSGMISVYSLAKSLKERGFYSKPLLIVAMVCQFFFCADIISLFVIKIAIKRNNSHKK